MRSEVIGLDLSFLARHAHLQVTLRALGLVCQGLLCSVELTVHVGEVQVCVLQHIAVSGHRPAHHTLQKTKRDINMKQHMNIHENCVVPDPHPAIYTQQTESAHQDLHTHTHTRP